MLDVYYSQKFKKDYKRMLKRGVKAEDFEFVLNELINQRELPKEYYDHNLKGNYEGFRECHINPDWLLIYRVEKQQLTLTLARTGSHADLF